MVKSTAPFRTPCTLVMTREMRKYVALASSDVVCDAIRTERERGEVIFLLIVPTILFTSTAVNNAHLATCLYSLS